jgi:hypothetical protein
MDPLTAAAAIAGLVGTIIAILVGLSNLVAFAQGQAEKRRAKRQKQQVTAETPPAETPPAELHAPAPLPPGPPSQGFGTTNLPAESTPLVGREQEVAEIRTLLQRGEVRMVTLVGPPGAGKTRLAIKVAATVVDEFADSVFFVALSALREVALVATTIAQAMGVVEVRGQSPAETLKRELRDKQVRSYISPASTSLWWRPWRCPTSRNPRRSCWRNRRQLRSSCSGRKRSSHTSA